MVRRKMITRFAFLSLSCLILMACTPLGVLTTVGTTAGTYAMEERGLEGATNDLGLKADIVGAWAQEKLSYASDLSVIVYNSKAMVMGAVESEEERAKAIALVWKVDGIKDVYNDIVLKRETGIEDFTHDTLINTRLFAALTFDGQIMDINYKYDAEGGTVYVIGFAQSHGELRRFIAHAKSIPYVRKVVSHVEVKESKSMYRPRKERVLSDAS
ncbi:BON domain-containing protein [Terasakiella sp.]|uniref:BON domain-containing protein n=1 Tax=Terasakiella sp. TaxID=2034861 RepID=UPI003AA945F8